jgi:hypothetical protein
MNFGPITRDDFDKTVVVVCRTGRRSNLITVLLFHYLVQVDDISGQSAFIRHGLQEAIRLSPGTPYGQASQVLSTSPYLPLPFARGRSFPRLARPPRSHSVSSEMDS